MKCKSVITRILEDFEFLFERGKTKYYQTSKFMIGFYEDDYKFKLIVVNVKDVKIDKAFYNGKYDETQESNPTYNKYFKNKMLEFLDLIR